MISSLLMLGSSLNKKTSKIFIVTWLAYMFFGSNLSLGITFPVINAVVFLTITVLFSKIKNNKINILCSVMSILVWSISIDIICYYLYPPMSSSISLMGYIYNGILFNYKYAIINVISLFIAGILFNLKKILLHKVKIICNIKEKVVFDV